jgi:hypothetical protein
MWQSEKWNGTEAALRNFVVSGIALVVVLLVANGEGRSIDRESERSERRSEPGASRIGVRSTLLTRLPRRGLLRNSRAYSQSAWKECSPKVKFASKVFSEVGGSL